MLQTPLPESTREITLAGKTYTLRPLAVQDHRDLMQWVQDRHVAIARRAAEGMERSERIEIIQGAIREAAALTLTSPATLRVLGELEGATRLLWMSLRHEHPELTQADLLNDLIADPETIQATLAEMQKVNAEAAAVEAPKTI